MTTPVDLAYLDAYIDRLRAHDWYFERADDPRPYKAGLAADQKLRREAASEPLLRDLFECAAFIFGTDRVDARPTQWQCWLSFDEFAEVSRRRLAAKAAPRPDVTHQLAKIVRALAGALARADPDNQAADRAIGALQRMGLLESTLMTPSVTVPDVAP